MNTMSSIENKISKLSPKLIEELDQYLDYLVNRRVIDSQKKLRLDWAGGLKEIKMSALELQKKSLEWRK